MSFVIVSDRPLGKREQFIREMLNEMAKLDVDKIAVVGRLPGGEIMTAYFNMGLEDMMLASSWINTDVVHHVIEANRDVYEEEE